MEKAPTIVADYCQTDDFTDPWRTRQGNLLLALGVRKRSRQAYRSLRENLSSRAKTLTFSPASIRRTMPTLNSRLKTRCDDLGLDIRSPMENCPLFSVSHFWGALQIFPPEIVSALAGSANILQTIIASTVLFIEISVARR